MVAMKFGTALEALNKRKEILRTVLQDEYETDRLERCDCFYPLIRSKENNGHAHTCKVVNSHDACRTRE